MGITWIENCQMDTIIAALIGFAGTIVGGNSGRRRSASSNSLSSIAAGGVGGGVGGAGGSFLRNAQHEGGFMPLIERVP